MTRTLTRRVAVVTGGTSGIGRVMARDLLAAGLAVVGCARDGQRLDVVAAELPGLIPVRCDLRESGARAALVQVALDRFGQVDVLVHNAGLGYVGAVADMTGPGPGGRPSSRRDRPDPGSPTPRTSGGSCGAPFWPTSPPGSTRCA